MWSDIYILLKHRVSSRKRDVLNVKEKSNSSYFTFAVNGSMFGYTCQGKNLLCSFLNSSQSLQCAHFLYTTWPQACRLVICLNRLIWEYKTFKHKTEIMKDSKHLSLEFSGERFPISNQAWNQIRNKGGPLCMDKYIQPVVQTCFYVLRNISRTDHCYCTLFHFY